MAEIKVDVRISEMDKDMVKSVVDVTAEALRRFSVDRDIASHIKHEFDRSSGRYEGELRVVPVKTGHSAGTAQLKSKEAKIPAGLGSRSLERVEKFSCCTLQKTIRNYRQRELAGA
ncbi:hypothetical protein CLF_108769 [Clonorchis sinensis]|uniref:Uncharacterized protein n=1 Tax=Clonorchis sinensis TaxID=79923 RepID=G7YIH4_CLOSI|nr:hypothetical protein CLF_108769 [Clonorchis sinensis]